MAHPCLSAWNYRNLGEVCSISASNQLCLQQISNLALLPATKQSGMEMILFRLDLGWAPCSERNCTEQGGGLPLFRTNELDLQVSFFSPLIDLELASRFCEHLGSVKSSHLVVVLVDLGECQWPLTGFFGQSETVSPLSGLCLGDINDILSKSEKEKGMLRFRLGSAWGAIDKFWCGRSTLHAVGEVAGVLKGQYGFKAGKGALDPLLKHK
ncbi:hypothetical protein SLA2020_493170 [Shorea laevis]